MKPRLLFLALLLASGLLQAQDTIRTLIITEARLDDARETYMELTNVGNTTLDLSQFEVGVVGPWTGRVDQADINKWFNVPAGSWFMLPAKNLEPGQSFVIATVFDWGSKMWAKDPVKYGTELWTKREFWKIADVQLHYPESPIAGDRTDSVTPYYHVLDLWNGRECLYVRHHVAPGDSVVVDQVNGFWTTANGQRPDGPTDVAGMTNATSQATLVRKYTVKQGNTTFVKGIDITDSEWLPIPHLYGGWEMWRALFWTAKNHGDYQLNETTLTSSLADVDWTNHTITLPWGVRKDDSVMFAFNYQPGFAWHYKWAPFHEDSTYYSARTGDTLTVYACGNTLEKIDFKIIVSAPTADANIVVMRQQPNARGIYSSAPPGWAVSDKVPGMDTISRIPYGLRADTLLKYLEKAPNASWEIVYKNGEVRSDLKDGDILKVTAESGAVKEYYIKPYPFRKSHEAHIASITWPDIPEFYRGLYGWVGDTVPNFSADNFDYAVQVPFDVDGIPALVGKTQDVNAKLQVTRAKNLTGAPEDRTVKFEVTAQDDTSKLDYNVLLNKEKDLANIQPWEGEPFISQLCFRDQWASTFMEIVNPGNQPLDLSNYMLAWAYVWTPAGAIQNAGTADAAGFNNRYLKYIPGYKWANDSTEWKSNVGIAFQDLAVNPIVQPGDVFVMGDIRGTGQSGYPWWASQQCDIDFGHTPWGVNINACLTGWLATNYYLFKIVNDSVKNGLKPATDPNDFELIDVFGNGQNATLNIGGKNIDQIQGFTRKPEIYHGNPEYKGSFGTDPASSEWLFVDRAYYDARGIGWPNDILFICQGLGSHTMNEVTIFKSTVASNSYKVSEGFSMAETIRGLVTGTTVDEFYAGLIKANDAQSLVVIHNAKGDTLTGTSVITDGDVLAVTSADGMNETNYILNVTAEGLSKDALLTSETLTVNATGATGTISGFDYGTSLRSVYDAVVVPFGATLTVVNGKNEYVPFLVLNYDTLYNEVQVSTDIYFDVIAEDGTTEILYQLQPNNMNGGAFVTSNVFVVDQDKALIDLVPVGTTVDGLLSFLIPAPGATVKILDKFGFERVDGFTSVDDRIVVTSQDGQTTKVYYLKVLDQKESYLAYVNSSVYTIDQFLYTIVAGSENITDLVTVATFLNNLVAAPGAVVKLQDKNGAEKTSGNMAMGDELVVTAADASTSVTYTVDVVSGINTQTKSVSVYPNPTSGKVYVSGIENGNNIAVTNMLGQRVITRNAHQSVEIISLEGQAKGFYFITISNGNQVIGRYKVVLK